MWARSRVAVVQGVVKALFENGLLPKVISGSSVGSISECPCWPPICAWLRFSYDCSTLLLLMSMIYVSIVWNLLVGYYISS